MTEVAKSPTAEEAAKLIGTYLAEFRSGGPNRKAESIAIGRQCGLKLEGIEARWAREELLISPPLSPTGNVAEKPIVATLRAITDWTEFCQSTSAALASGKLTPLEAETLIAEWDNGPEAWKDFVEKTEEPKATVTLTDKDGAPFNFHPSDLAADPLPVATIADKQRWLEELADLRDTDPLAYVEKRKQYAKRLTTTNDALDKAVKLVRDSRPKDEEQSQATKVMAVGLSSEVRLWHSPEGIGYASVFDKDHWENYRIKSSGFEKYLRVKYGETNQVKVGETLVPQAPGAQALKDGISGLESHACRNGTERTPAIRVGGTKSVIWLDLGRPEWDAVKITGEGWKVVPNVDIPFIRTANSRPLPIPARGGNINDLRKVLNVRKEDFILACGWLTQFLCPIGPYPHVNPEGESENGKSTVCKLLLRIADHNAAGLRKVKTVDDLLISLKNNWGLGLDNLSVMSIQLSDVLCMVATGIATGARTLYTDDEESAFTIQRPMIFSGIPSELAERGDLASRTIKLYIPPIAASARIGETDLEAAFVEMWPRVLGALLDGLVGAIQNWQSIELTDHARLADFEMWAEAGCQAMGFPPMAFVNAYKANRDGSMEASVDASPIGRAVRDLMKSRPTFEGKMEELLKKLQTYRRGTADRDWPKDATRLATAIRRVKRPLAAIGILVETNVDRRFAAIGGTQKDIVIKRQ